MQALPESERHTTFIPFYFSTAEDIERDSAAGITRKQFYNAVRVLGGRSPSWTTSATPPGSQAFEFTLVHTRAKQLPVSQAEPDNQIVFCDTHSLMEDRTQYRLLVRSECADIPRAALGLASIFSHPQWIGVDWSNIDALSGYRTAPSPYGTKTVSTHARIATAFAVDGLAQEIEHHVDTINSRIGAIMEQNGARGLYFQSIIAIASLDEFNLVKLDEVFRRSTSCAEKIERGLACNVVGEESFIVFYIFH